MSNNPYRPGGSRSVDQTVYNNTTVYSVQNQSQNYPPPPPSISDHTSSSTLYANTVTKEEERTQPPRFINRTPSPTPSEITALSRKSLFDYRQFLDPKFWLRREWLWYYVAVVIILVIVILVTVYDKQIVHALEPTARKIHDLPAGWLIPIAIFFVISFPPLFGHEIVAILCGLVWGIGVGFAIVAAGTYIGEVGNFYAFKSCCRARGEKLEREKLQYGCLARIVRDGGLKIALIARFSAIPGHFTTAVFSTCGMNIFVFSIAAILSLPKQFIVVYIGVLLEEAGTTGISKRDKIIQYTVLFVTVAVTYLAMWYISREMNRVKPDVIYARRKARQAKMQRANASGASYPYSTAGEAEASSSTVAFNPDASSSNFTLNPGETSPFQQWDAQGRAVGFTGDPTLHAPQPKRASNAYSVDRTATNPYASFGEKYHETAYDGMRQTHDKPLAPVRQESGDSVGWDMQNQGMAQDDYRLPEFKTQSPRYGESSNARTPTQAVYSRTQSQSPSRLTDAPYVRSSPPPIHGGHSQDPTFYSLPPHSQEPSADSAYYTPSHSRGPSEEPLTQSLPPNLRPGHENQRFNSPPS